MIDNIYVVQCISTSLTIEVDSKPVGKYLRMMGVQVRYAQTDNSKTVPRAPSIVWANAIKQHYYF